MRIKKINIIVRIKNMNKKNMNKKNMNKKNMNKKNMNKKLINICNIYIKYMIY